MPALVSSPGVQAWRLSQGSTSEAQPSITRCSTACGGIFSSTGCASIRRSSTQGPDVCLSQIADGLEMTARRAGVTGADIVAVGLDTPGPASATGVLSAKGLHQLRACRLGGVRSAGQAGAAAAAAGGLSERRQCRRAVGAHRALWIRDAGHDHLGDHRHRHRRRGRRRRPAGERPARIRRGSRARADSVAIDRGDRGPASAVQLRPHRRPRVALLADGDPADAFAARPPEVSRSSAAGRRSRGRRRQDPRPGRRRRPDGARDLPRSRRARSGCSSTRWSTCSIRTAS